MHLIKTIVLKIKGYLLMKIFVNYLMDTEIHVSDENLLL